MNCFVPRWLALVAAVALAGCGDTNISEITSTIKDTASQGASQVTEKVKEATATASKSVTTVTETLELAGSMELSVNAPMKTGGCYVHLIESPSGRPTILQMQSYKSKDQESFPSVFIRAEVPTGSASTLAGQTVAADMFVLAAADGPLWFSRKAPVQLKIASVQEKVVSAEIVGGELFNTADGTSSPVKGSCSGALQ